MSWLHSYSPFLIWSSVTYDTLLGSHSEPKVEKSRLYHAVETRVVLIVEDYWDEFVDALRKLMQNKFLERHGLEDCLALEVGNRLWLPLIRSAHWTQVREKELDIHVEVGVKIIRLHIDFRSEETDIVDLDFLFAVSYKERPWVDRWLVVRDWRGCYVMMVYMPCALLLSLFLLRYPRSEDAVWVRIVKLYRIHHSLLLTSSLRLLYTDTFT